MHRNFLVAHFVSGLGWAYFASLGCEACQVDQFTVVKAVVMLLAIAATALIASSLRGALIVTFALPVAVYAITGVKSWMTIEAIMVGLLILSLPFFSYVASQLNKSALMLLSFRTEKDALIAELETAKSMSDEARSRAEEANLAKSRFLASMSHELRTPLNAILGFSEVMANEVLGPMGNPTYREYARDIHDSGQHLLDLINEILDLSRIEAGRYQLNEEPVMLLACGRGLLPPDGAEGPQQGHPHRPGVRARHAAALCRRTRRAPDHAQPSVQRHQVHADRRRNPRPGRLDGRRRPVSFGSRQWTGHSGRRNPDRAVGVRPGLDRHQERRTGHRPRPADRAGPGRHAWRRVRAELEAARRHRGDRHLPADPRHGSAAGRCRPPAMQRGRRR